MSTCYLYVRKSTESEDRQVLSIESQINELQDYAAKNNLKIVKTFSESKSAKKPGRPVFSEMMKEIWKKGNTGILCWKLDRLARNGMDGSNLIYALEEGKITEIVTPNQTYRNNSNDKFMMNLEFGMAKKYVDDLSDNVKRGMKAKALKGWFPERPPLGYLNYRNLQTGESTIIKDPQRFLIVRKVWDLMLTGNYSVRQILKIANEKLGLRTKLKGGMPGKKLCLSGIYKILINPFYSGLFIYKNEICQGKHEPMVTLDEFDKVQVLLGRKKKSKAKKHFFPFTGIIGCGECSCMITAEEKQKLIKETQQLRSYIYYRCTKKKQACNQSYIEQQQLQQQIETFLKSIQILPEYCDWVFKYLDRIQAKESKKDQLVTDNLKQKSQALQKQLNNLLMLKISESNSDGGLLSNEEYLAQKNRILNEKLRLEEEIRRSQPSINPEVHRLTAEAFKFARFAYFWFKNGTPEMQKKIFACLGSNYILKDRKLSIQAKKPLAIIQERLKMFDSQNGRLEPIDFDTNAEPNKLPAEVIPVLWALVNDVRTEIEGNPGQMAFPIHR